VGGQEVQEPACNLVIRAAREHAGILASGPRRHRHQTLGGPGLQSPERDQSTPISTR
jgi:hypothetical protein